MAQLGRSSGVARRALVGTQGRLRQRNLLHRALERLQDDGTDLGRQLRADRDRAIALPVIAQPAMPLLLLLARELGDLTHVAPVPHQLLDVIRRAVARDLQEIFVGARIRDARDRADLRVAQLATFHRGADVRQLRERVPDAYFLARRAEPDAALPVEPVRAGLRETVRPSAATIELRDHTSSRWFAAFRCPRAR
jgi:hypothetical protein